MKQFGISEEDVRDLTEEEDEQWEKILKEKGIAFGSETGACRSPLLDNEVLRD